MRHQALPGPLGASPDAYYTRSEGAPDPWYWGEGETKALRRVSVSCRAASLGQESRMSTQICPLAPPARRLVPASNNSPHVHPPPPTPRQPALPIIVTIIQHHHQY